MSRRPGAVSRRLLPLLFDLFAALRVGLTSRAHLVAENLVLRTPLA